MHDNILKKIKSHSTKILIISASLILSFFIGIIIFINLFLTETKIEEKFNDISGLNLKLNNSKIFLDYKLNLNTTADSIIIHDAQKKENFITLENPRIRLKLSSLLFKKIYIKNLDAKKIDISITRNTDGKINLVESIKKRDWKLLKIQDFTLARLDSNIENINLIFDDNYKIKNTTKLLLEKSKINISKHKKTINISQKGIIETSLDKNSKASLSLNINSKYPLNNFNSDNLGMDISLKDVNLYVFNDLIKNYISKDILALKGNLDLEIKTNQKDENFNHSFNAIIQNPNITLANGEKISPYKKDIEINSLFKANKNSIKIEDFKIASNELNIQSKGEILKPFSKKQELNFNTKITNTQLNNFLYFLPDNLIFYRPKGIPTLKKSNFFALLNGEINLNSSPLNVNGNLKASNVHIPNYPKPFRQNDIYANFIGDKVKINTRIYTPSNEYVVVNGISNLDKSLYGEYNISSTKKIDLAFAQLYLVPIQQIIGFNIGPVPIMDIKGFGNIDIKTQGTLKDAEIYGEFEAFNSTANLKGINAELTNATCKLIFNGKDMLIKEIKGKLDGADFLLIGKGNTSGKIEIETNIKNALTSKIVNIFNHSVISEPYLKYTKNIVASSGAFEGNINLKGTIKDFENQDFINTLIPSGKIALKNNTLIFNNGLGAKNITGYLNFGETQEGFFGFNINDTIFNTQFNSKTSLEKISKGELFEIENHLYSNKIQFKDLINEYKKATFLNKTAKNVLEDLATINFYTKLNIKSQGKISLDSINLNNLKNQGYIIGLNSSTIPDINFQSGLIRIENNKIIFNNFDANILQGKIKAKGNVENFLSKTPNGDLNILIKNLNLEKISKILPKIKTQNAILKNGLISFKGENLKLNSISLNCNSMPIFIDANIKNIYTTKTLNANFSTILNETTSDSVINPYLTYPIKLKGEVPIKGTFKGNNINYAMDINAILPKDTDVSFSGANLGDANHKREIEGKFEVKDNSANINSFKYIKYIANQNNKINPTIALKASGKINQKDKEISYDNFKITTNQPINVRILNLIFKKSLLKKGSFECNITLNDDIKKPKSTGKIILQDLDIPLYNTQINNINFNLSNNFIEGTILAKNKESDLKVFLRANNNFEAPYIINDLNIASQKMDIFNILNNITPQNQKNDITAKQEIQIKPEDIIVKKGTFDFKEVQYDKIFAQNLKGEFSYKDNLFNLKNIALNIAQGKINAKGTYDINSADLILKADMQDCDSNSLTNDFLNLQGQIYGLMDGSIELNAKNLNTPQAIKNMDSKITFLVDNGKMPKLGSLEYLLRAGNLIKNGIMGLSLNNIIQVLTPYKTGEFEKISGSLNINKGKIENLEILTKGKNLSLFLEGEYNILESFADIKIYGKLSQNISNALGAVGNASINQFINTITSRKSKNEKDNLIQEKFAKIPAIENETQQPRYFRAKVSGDINKDNYIKSFDWD